jgi:dihydrodipicolinate synthase/N-acetylneuraminate lyase
VVGGTGAFSALAGVAPKLARQIYDLCAKQKFTEARKPQEDMAALHHLLKLAGFAGLKGALRAMGRECGAPRPPARALGEVEAGRLAEQIGAMAFLRAEPRGW